MEITKVVVSMGRTVNRGNFENTRYDVSVTAEFEPGEFKAHGAEAVALDCRHELVTAMSGDLREDLEGLSWKNIVTGEPMTNEARVKKALEFSPIFRHMYAVDDLFAEGLLHELVDGEAKWGDPVEVIDAAAKSDDTVNDGDDEGGES